MDLLTSRANTSRWGVWSSRNVSTPPAAYQCQYDTRLEHSYSANEVAWPIVWCLKARNRPTIDPSDLLASALPVQIACQPEDPTSIAWVLRAASSGNRWTSHWSAPTTARGPHTTARHAWTVAIERPAGALVEGWASDLSRVLRHGSSESGWREEHSCPWKWFQNHSRTILYARIGGFGSRSHCRKSSPKVSKSDWPESGKSKKISLASGLRDVRTALLSTFWSAAVMSLIAISSKGFESVNLTWIILEETAIRGAKTAGFLSLLSWFYVLQEVRVEWCCSCRIAWQCSEGFLCWRCRFAWARGEGFLCCPRNSAQHVVRDFSAAHVALPDAWSRISLLIESFKPLMLVDGRLSDWLLCDMRQANQTGRRVQSTTCICSEG